MRNAAKVIRVSAVGLIIAVVTGCGGDDGNAIQEQGRFCELARQFDDAVAGAGLTGVPGRVEGPPDAFGTVLTQMGATVDEMETNAPGDVRDDVETVVEAVKKGQQGDLSGVQAPEFTKARSDIASFLEKNCNTGAGSGDG